MAQRVRHDESGAWLHVYNRGIAKRTVFERTDDCRYFLAQLARAVRAGWFEVHAFALLTTHYHVLLRSLRGEAWRGMRRVQNGFVRHFNRLRRRDGPLFRGRFGSRRIRSERHWWNTVRYIDDNAVAAGLARDAASYPWCSAHHFAQARQPKWLTTEEVWKWVAAAGNGDEHDAAAYRRALGDGLTETERDLIGSRLTTGDDGLEAVDDLIDAAPDHVRAWMVRKARLADGTRTGMRIVTADTVECVVAAVESEWDGRVLDLPGTRRSAWRVLRAGILRSLAGVRSREIALRAQCAESTAFADVRAHQSALQASQIYADVAAECVVRALAADWRRRDTGR